MDPDEARSLEHPRRDAQLGCPVAVKGSVEELGGNLAHPASAACRTRVHAASRRACGPDAPEGEQRMRSGASYLVLAGIGESPTEPRTSTVASSPPPRAQGWPAHRHRGR